jgi:hypothetical protein
MFYSGFRGRAIEGTLTGRMIDCGTGEELDTNTESRTYLMPWGDQLIGVSAVARKKMDYQVHLAWEHDHWLMRALHASFASERFVGCIGRHPLSPPMDSERVGRFQENIITAIGESPLACLGIFALAQLDACSRRHYSRIKRDTANVFGHALQLHCTECTKTILKDGMRCCDACKFHMPVCSKACFKLYWRTHKVVCGRHKLVKATVNARPRAL